MICPHCGKESSEPYCGNCGTPLMFQEDDEKTISMRGNRAPGGTRGGAQFSPDPGSGVFQDPNDTFNATVNPYSQPGTSYPGGSSTYPGGNSTYPGGSSTYPGGNSTYPGSSSAGLSGGSAVRGSETGKLTGPAAGSQSGTGTNASGAGSEKTGNAGGEAFCKLVAKTFFSPLMLTAAIAYTLQTVFVLLSSIMAAVNGQVGQVPPFSLLKLFLAATAIPSNADLTWIWVLLSLVPTLVITTGLWLCCFSASTAHGGRKMSSVGLWMILCTMLLDGVQFLFFGVLDLAQGSSGAAAAASALLGQSSAQSTVLLVTEVLLMLPTLLFYLSAAASLWFLLQALAGNRMPKYLPFFAPVYCFVLSGFLLLILGGIFTGDLVHSLACCFSLISLACFGTAALRFRDQAHRIGC